MKMKMKAIFLFFFLLFSFSFNVAFAYTGDEGWGGDQGGAGGAAGAGPGGAGGGGGAGEGERREIFVLPESKQVMRSEAGEFRVVRGFRGGKGMQSGMDIGFINMEPQSLFLPQYLDSDLIFFVRRGKAKIGWISKYGLAEKNLKIGDVYRIPSGSTFYILNTDEGQRLQLICSIDTSESFGLGTFESFFIAGGGGMSPLSILAGFGDTTLTTAFNVSSIEWRDLLARQKKGPVIFANASHESSVWAALLELKHQERLFDEVEEDEDVATQEGQDWWIWRKLANFATRDDSKSNKKRKESKESSKAPDAYNLYDRKPDFENNYGTTKAVMQDDYEPLGQSGVSGIGVYHVNLTAGAMLAPHMNPMAAEYGIVLKGLGTVQVVYPNGSSAMNTLVREGDVFWIPRYFPFCQIASREGPFEFFGFTTSGRDNRPQFFAGIGSVLEIMRGPELAMALGVSEDRLDKFFKAQNASIIVPSALASPPHRAGGGDREGSVIKLWE